MKTIEPAGFEVKPYGDYIIHFKDENGEKYECNVSTAPDRLLLKDKIIEGIRYIAKGTEAER